MGCTDGCSPKVEQGASPAYVRVLWLVVLLNGAMFFVGVAIALIGRSVSVRADVLDFLGDAVATAVGLLLVGRSARTRATVSFWQGVVLGALGVYALVSAVQRAFGGEVPEALTMGIYGVLGLCVNVGSALLLLKHRNGDSNVRAVWLYSRNDAIGNIAVLGAAGATWLTGVRWPDVLVGAAIAALFLHSAFEIVRRARAELNAPSPS
jgi:cation diffusion facilitator family transporter